jgi:hypothetical protein
MDKAEDARLKKLFENSAELKYAGEVVEIPVLGWVDSDCKVHYYDQKTEPTLLPIPKTDLEKIED